MKSFSPTGADRFSANIRDMTGHSPLLLFKLCWKYLTPAVCTVSDPLPADPLSHWDSMHIGACLGCCSDSSSCLSISLSPVKCFASHISKYFCYTTRQKGSDTQNSFFYPPKILHICLFVTRKCIHSSISNTLVILANQINFMATGRF